jgi:hypothetical protein
MTHGLQPAFHGPVCVKFRDIRSIEAKRNYKIIVNWMSSKDYEVYQV